MNDTFIKARLTNKVERGQRRRAGLVFTSEEVIYKVTEEQLKMIEEDPMIKFDVIDEKETSASMKATVSKKVPEKDENKDLKKGEIIAKLVEKGYKEGTHFTKGDNEADLLSLLNS